MTTFLDGPAHGQFLYLKRSPRFLRVTQNGITFDALDQLDDEPEETEILYVYEIVSPPRGYVSKGSGLYPVAQYRYFTPQPHDGLIRPTHSWRGWTQRQASSPIVAGTIRPRP